jgi:hypothetical protein
MWSAAPFGRVHLNQSAPQERATMKQLFRKKFSWIFTLAVSALVLGCRFFGSVCSILCR